MDFQLRISDNLNEVAQRLGALGKQLQSTFSKSGQAVQPLKQSLSQLNTQLDSLKQTRTLSVDSKQIKQLNKEISGTELQIKRLEKSFEPLSTRLSEVGQKLSIGLTAPILAFGVSSLKTAGNFEAAMNRVAAKSQATSEEMRQLNQLAKNLGATTQFSATEAASGLEFLAQAGFNAKQQLQALPGVLNLAAAGNVDLGRASDIATNVLSQFRLTAGDTSKVVDVLAKATISSNTNLEQLADAMNYLGPTAAALGVTLEDAAAVVEIMSNNGLQGSLGTRALGTALTRLTKPTKQMSEVMTALNLEFFDSQGKFIGVEKTIALLENRMQGMTQKQKASTIATLFGAEAFQEFNILLAEGSQKIGKLSADLQNAGGTAERVAKTNMAGFNGALKDLGSAFEGVQIAIANSGILEFATKLIGKATEMVRAFTTLNPKLLQVITIMGGLAAAIGPVLLIVGKLIPVFKGVALAMSVAALKVIAITAVVGGLIVVVKAIYDSWEPVSAFFKRLWAGVQIQFSTSILALINSVEGLTKPLGITFDGAEATLKGFIKSAVDTLNTTPPVTFSAALGSVGDNIKNTFVSLKEAVTGSLDATNDALITKGNEIVGNAQNLGNGLGGALNMGVQRPDAEGAAPQAIAPIEIPLLPKLPEDLSGFMEQIQPLIDKTSELGEALKKPNEALQTFGQNMANSFGQAVQAVASGASSIKDAIRGIIKALISQGVAAVISNTLKNSSISGPFAVALAGGAGVAAGALFDKLIPKFATGGFHQGGLRIVGERGPELEATGASRIVPNNRLADMLGGGGASRQELFGTISISGEQLQILLNNNENRNEFVL